MRKRVSICRTLALDPEILFLDEPFGPLDVFTKEILQEDILRIWQDTRKTMVFITHDLMEAITLADKVVLMSARPGRIEKTYSIDLKRPRSIANTRFDEDFIRLHKEIFEDLSRELSRARGAGMDE